MGKLIATTQATVDGVIDPVGEWVQADGDHAEYSFERQAGSGGLVLGRKTYEGLAAYWPTATGKWADMVNALPKYVGSRTLSGNLEWNATLLEGDLEDSIPRLKDEVDGDLFMHGSGEFAYALAERGVIDEYEVYLNPLVWGEGNVHVLGDRGTVWMKLEDVKRFDSGVVLLTYLPASWRRRHRERRCNRMSLSNYRVGAAASVSDMARAREFYEGKLGLEVSIDSGNNVQYRCAEGTVFHVYASEYAGKSEATVAGWGVDDIELVVDELTRKGVAFEQYDEPGLKTDEKGIATFEGDARVAYFKDPDGNTLSIAQAPRS